MRAEQTHVNKTEKVMVSVMNNYEFTAKNMNDILENINEIKFYLQHYNEDAEINNLRLNYLINAISDKIANQLEANKYFYEEENKTSGD